MSASAPSVPLATPSPCAVASESESAAMPLAPAPSSSAAWAEGMWMFGRWMMFDRRSCADAFGAASDGGTSPGGHGSWS